MGIDEMGTDNFVYSISQPESVDVERVQLEAAAAWQEMKMPGTFAHAAAEEAKIRTDELPATLAEVLVIEPHGAGVSGVEVVIAGAVGKMAYVAWKDIWTKIIFPKLQRKFGDDALQESKKQ